VSNSGKFLLGKWQVFPQENRIAKGTLSLTIEPKAMDVFLYLATHAGEVVSADKLLSHC
jgi:DNA-binding winged helix-turn-helix (wHTH) protein